jgi:hypothetical protein
MREQAMMFLQGMAKDPVYALATQQIIHDLQQLSEHAPLPARYCNPTLPLTLLAHPSALHATTRQTQAHIHVTQGTHTGRSLETSRRGSDRDRSRSQERSFDRNRGRSHERRSTSVGSPNRRASSFSRSQQSTGRTLTHRNVDLQCKACATNGHTHADCRMLPKVVAIMDLPHNTLRRQRRFFITTGKRSTLKTAVQHEKRSSRFYKERFNKVTSAMWQTLMNSPINLQVNPGRTLLTITPSPSANSNTHHWRSMNLTLS